MNEGLPLFLFFIDIFYHFCYNISIYLSIKRKGGLFAVQSKLEIYGRKKLVLIYVLLGIVILSVCILSTFTIVFQRWDLLGLCCGIASLLFIVLLWLVNLSSDVTVDYEKQTIRSNLSFRKACGWKIGFEEVQKTEIVTKQSLNHFYKGKFLPKCALCIYLGENQVKVISGTWLSNRQLQLLHEKIKEIGEGCK